jgi:MFS transporter, PAT family, beta-lactamase induction signal transducer AmpG
LIFALLFLLFYRFGETLLSGGIIPLFLLDPVAKGGLGLDNQFTGLSYGIIAPIVIVIGGLLGGFSIYRFGFNKMKWWMLLCINVPNVIYIYLAYAQPTSRVFIASCIAMEQFFYAYSLGTYQIFLMYKVKDSRFKTAHYSFFAGVMLLGNMIPKMLSGWMQQSMGYQHFFIIVCLMIIPGAFVVKMLKVDKDYGKRTKKKA